MSHFCDQFNAAIRDLRRFMFCVCKVTILASSAKSSITTSRSSGSRKVETGVGLSQSFLEYQHSGEAGNHADNVNLPKFHLERSELFFKILSGILHIMDVNLTGR